VLTLLGSPAAAFASAGRSDGEQAGLVNFPGIIS
jgi:hypothetical protein